MPGPIELDSKKSIALRHRHRIQASGYEQEEKVMVFGVDSEILHILGVYLFPTCLKSTNPAERSSFFTTYRPRPIELTVNISQLSDIGAELRHRYEQKEKVMVFGVGSEILHILGVYQFPTCLKSKNPAERSSFQLIYTSLIPWNYVRLSYPFHVLQLSDTIPHAITGTDPKV